jgi:hypothetical protein
MISPFPETSTVYSSRNQAPFHTIGPLTHTGNGAYEGHALATACKPLLTSYVLPPNLGVRVRVNRGRGRHGADGPSCNKFGITGG